MGAAALEDRDLEWMAELDWSLHGLKGTTFVSDNKLIAAAAALLGEHAAPFWPDEDPYFLARAGNTPRGRWVEADVAFGPGGILTSLYYDTRDLAISHARDLLIPLASPGDVTPAEWEAISDAGMELWAVGEGARRMWWKLAPLVARLAADRKIVTFARPVGGGTEEPVRAALWKLDPDTAVKRLARCGLNLERPFDSEAAVTHHLFVESVGLGHVMQDTARENYIPHSFVDDVFPRPIDEKSPSDALMRAHLHKLMLENPEWTVDDFNEALETKYSTNIGPRPFRRMREAVLADDPALARIVTKSGPKRK